MSHELLYTSAPAGLKPGTVGFSAVESTQGMPRLLSESLELLSAYRWEYVPPDPRSALNPVNFSHLLFRTGGQKYRILSRVGDAGMDYTGRTNKLAHHVVLEPHELAPGGPAFTLATPDFCVTQFSGEARWLTEGRRPKHGTAPPGPCRAWHTATNGHAGWAGVLAASALDGDSRPMNVIFPAGLETLPLVVEAMKLLPANRMWETSFSTYFTTLPPGFDCQWRFLLDGTREAEAARAAGGPRLIDLARGVGPAPDTDLAFLATHGTPRPAGVVPRAAAATVAVPTLAPRSTIAPQARPTVRVPRDDEIEELAARSRWNLPLALTAAALAVGIVGLGLWAVLVPPPVTVAGPSPDTPAVSTDEAKGKSELETILEQATDEPEPVVAFVPTTQAPSETATDSTQTTESKPEEVTTEIEQLPPALQDVKGKTLPLPGLDAGVGVDLAPKVLTKIHVHKASDCELDVLTLSDKKDTAFEIDKPIDDAAANSRVWKVLMVTPDPLGGDAIKKHIGTFHLRGRDLSYQWEPPPQYGKPMKLMYRKLELRVANEVEKCYLSQAFVIDATPVAFSTNQKIEIPIRPGSVEPKDPLRLELQVRGVPESSRTIRLNLKETAEMRLPFSNSDVTLTLRITFEEENGGPGPMALELLASGERVTIANDVKVLNTEPQKVPRVTFIPPDPMPFITSQLRSIPKDSKDELFRLDKGLKTLASLKQELNRDRSANEDAVRLAGNDKAKADFHLRQIGIIDGKLPKIAAAEQQLSKAQTILARLVAWCDDTSPQLEDMRGKVTVEYEAFIEEAGERFSLVRTANFQTRSESPSE